MQLATTGSTQATLNNMANMPALRQLILILGLAASIATGVYTVFWMQDKDYVVLHNNLNGNILGDVTGILDRNGIAYKIDPDSGSVMVESGRVNDAKLKLALENIPVQVGQGFEILDKDTGFGTSNFIQTVRYQRALEGELSRTIAAMKPVQEARVHLALPKESAFIREARKPTASVMVRLYPGHKLEKSQIDAIANLVASGIPSLSRSQVTVVDDKGNLLSSDRDEEGLQLTQTQYQYKKNIESDYTRRIENILIPIVGLDNIRAQVNASVDFTVHESTRESYNPDLPALRSERREEQENTGSVNAGIPGALSNQPPAEATAPVQAGGENQQNQAVPTSTSRRTTRNYELDRTISRTRNQTGNIERLSVAVAINFKQTADENGNLTPVQYTDDELENLTNLVKQAVGFDQLRGDSVKLLNLQFTQPEAIVALPDIPVWEQGWIRQIAKLLLGFVILMVIVLGVLRPVMRNLSIKPVSAAESTDDLIDDQISLSGDSPAMLHSPSKYEENLQKAKSIASQEPVLVAQVVKTWMTDQASK